MTSPSPVDRRPYSFDYEGAAQYSGLKKSRIERLAREGILEVRYAGPKLPLVLGDSLRAYLSGLPGEPS